MVTINTSGTFLTNIVSEESSSENDPSGLENMFASMFSLLSEKSKTNEHSYETPEVDNVMLLMEEIKRDLTENGVNELNKIISDGGGDLFKSNILKIYERYKSLLTEVAETSEEPTIKFKLESWNDKRLNPSINNKLGHDTSGSNQYLTSQQPHSEGNTFTDNEIEALNRFSEAELQKIRNNMRNSQDMVSGIDGSKVKKETNENSAITNKTSTMLEKEIAKVSQIESEGIKEITRKALITNQKSTDRLSPETATESQLQTTKTSSLTKSIPIDSNGQGTQNNLEAHLKLLQKNWGKDIAKIIERAIASGKEKIEISLEPQRLGKMYLTLSVSNNQTSIAVSTESAAASLILSSSEERLAQMFESSGLKLSNFQASANNENSGKNGTKSDRNNNVASDDASVANEAEELEESLSNDNDGRKIINLIA